MLNKLILSTVVFLLGFFTLYPNISDSSVYAEACPNLTNRVIQVDLFPPTPGPDDFIAVAYEQFDTAVGTVTIFTADANEDVIWTRDLDKVVLNELNPLFEIHLKNDNVPVVVGKAYILRIRNLNAGTCGQAGFTVTSGGFEPSDANFQKGSPADVYNFGITTLPRIVITGATEGVKYKFNLGGQWKGDNINEKGATGRGKEFTAGLGGTIIILDICDNGEAGRPPSGSNPCEDAFRIGSYTIALVQVSNSQVVTSTKFKVEVVLNVVEGEEKVIDLDADEIRTPFGIIKGTPEGLAQAILSLGVGAAGGFAFLLMVFGAYRLIFAGGNPESIQEGRQVITAAIVGLIVVVLAVFLLDLIGISILGLDIL